VITSSLVDRMIFSVSRQFQEEDYDSRDCQILWVIMYGKLSKEERFKHWSGGCVVNGRRHYHWNTNRAVNGG
jgi:hypothetical protein